MSFESDLLDLTGTAADSFDIKATVRRCFFYDFDGYPTRLWDGQGVLTTATGVGAAITGYRTIASNQWLGTINAAGENMHTVPAVTDPRDGSSPRYSFSMPFIDEETYEALKASQDLAKDREVVCYYALFHNGEGLLPQTELKFAWRMIMRGVIFKEGVSLNGGKLVKTFSASVLARSIEYGRSRVPSGVMTDAAQRQRASLLGLASDSGCSFVAKNHNRTYTVGG